MAMMTVRLDAELLQALKERAKRSGRSVSAEVIRLIRKEIVPRRSRKRQKTMGMFSHLGTPPDLATFKRDRRSISSQIERRFRKR